MDSYKKSNIKQWALEDRPREKLLYKGVHSLSEAELLAILIGSGIRNLSAVDIGKQLLMARKNNLHELAKCSVHELTKVQGIGQTKAITLLAALELGKRLHYTLPINRPKIISSGEAHKHLAPVMTHLSHEEFWVLYLNRANRLVERRNVSSGGITGTVFDVRLVFKHALLIDAPNLILGHNHPSGNLSPSQADRDITRKAIEGGKLMNLEVLDHLILSDAGYFSFSDEGLI